MPVPAITEIFGLTGKKWDGLAQLGEGGQGAAYNVRSAEARKRRNGLIAEIQQSVKQIASVADPAPWVPKLAEAITAYQQGDDPASTAVLKYFKIPDGGGAEAQKAMHRLEKEVEALGRVQAPGLLRLIDASPDQRWMVTEYHPGGTLLDQLTSFRGDALKTLEALRPLVAAVGTLHAEGIIHRDIKPQNIFVASDRRLVLGDFGIVLFEGGSDRLTETYERVGTREWMAPWANTGMRIDDVNPSFDVFPLAKVLWCMASGQRQLPYWWHRREAYDLQKLFPEQPYMSLINEILDRCLVDTEQACLPSAKELLELLDERIEIMRNGGERLRFDLARPCRVCGRGQYVHWPPDGPRSIERVFIAVPRSDIDPSVKQIAAQPFHHVGKLSFTVRLFACGTCGHVQMFHWPDGVAGSAWEAAPRG